ncbi:hypothetical protein AWN76_009845 [Rhodothermaceae bacterium RA]|nr:hypothetical protein AWN76_009845 [Rhodothermaceae bacterium RA]
MHRCLLVVLLGLLGSGCAANRSAAPPGPAPSSPARPDLSALIQAVFTRPPEAATLPILDHLPPPDRVQRDTIRNLHVPSQIDTLRTYHYDGLVFTVYVTPEKMLMRDIRVTGPAYTSPEGLQVGQSRSDVEARLGPPDRHEGGTFVYEREQAIPHLLRIRFREDTVEALEWLFYID